MSILHQEFRPGDRVLYVGRGITMPATVATSVKSGVRIVFAEPLKLSTGRTVKVMSVQRKMLKREDAVNDQGPGDHGEDGKKDAVHVR